MPLGLFIEHWPILERFLKVRDVFYLDGKIVERKDARVSVEDRGYQFADGVYEVTKFYGRRPLRLENHLARL